jgi:hypothetical protein
VFPIASISSWPRKPRNWTTFQAPWEPIALLVGRVYCSKDSRPRRHDNSWTSCGASSRARQATHAVVRFATSTGRSESHWALTLTVCSASLIPGVYADESMSAKGERISRLHAGVRHRKDRHPHRSGNPATAGSFSRSRPVRATADGPIREGRAGPIAVS